MIGFACANCEASLKVKDALAGRSVKCPKCQQPVRVPAAADDAPLSRPRADLGEGVRLPTQASSGSPAPVTEAYAGKDTGKPSPADWGEVAGHYRYQLDDEIARGGMGAILRAIDHDIQREVAVKFLRNTADARQKARFVEEAQITGQLEHPNIVPIHQLGVDADGRSFFSMKMVKGRSLAEILKQQGEPRPSGSAGAITLGKLLNIFVSICNARAYAHSRNVIHRDLKPANVMVGNFGEVYVMDWGLAKLLSRAEPALPVPAATHLPPKRSAAGPTHPESGSGSKSGERVTTNRASVGDLTEAGAIMGTLAYMPPEQALAGKEVRCPQCKQLVQIPAPTEGATVPPRRDQDLGDGATVSHRTACEEFVTTRPAFRWRHLVALARVTASEYGHPSPGYVEATRLLKI